MKKDSGIDRKIDGKIERWKDRKRGIYMSEKKFLPPILETERLILRPLTMEDKPAIYKWAGNPEVTRYMIYPNYNTEDDADIWLNSLYNKEKEFDYGLVWKETGELIGSGGLYGKADDIWTIGYNIRQDMWGRGIVPEACEKIIEYVRAHFKVRAIQGDFAVENSKSKRVMEKLGMTFLEDTECTKLDGSATFKAKRFQRLFD